MKTTQTTPTPASLASFERAMRERLADTLYELEMAKECIGDFDSNEYDTVEEAAEQMADMDATVLRARDDLNALVNDLLLARARAQGIALASALACLALLTLLILTHLWVNTLLGCSPTPPPGYAHYPALLQYLLDARCHA